jgi:hypothetical protein
MAFWCNEKFWLEDYRELFCNVSTIPEYQTHINVQLNAISRLVILIAIFLLLISKTLSLVFLIMSFLFIILIYYIQRDKMKHYSNTPNDSNTRNGSTIENFTTCKNGSDKNVQDKMFFAKAVDSNLEYYELTAQPCRTTNICNKIESPQTLNGYMEQFPEDNYNQIENPTLNQRLVGGANPKTMIAPPVLHPITDIDHWRQDNTVNHSRTNAPGYHDLHASGYDIGILPVNDNYKKYLCNPEKLICTRNGSYKRIASDTDELQTVKPNGPKPNGPKPNERVSGRPNENPNGVRNNATGNYPNMFVQTVQPNIFSHSEVIEPIQSNYGISNTRNLPPRGVSYDNLGNTMYERSPYIIEDNTPEPIGIAEHNVYDPRFTGYGSSKRSYVHELTGQPRHYYDDINSVRMPNYLVRSNIDFARYADSYGPLNSENHTGNQNTYGIRELANETFLQNSLQHRSDISERLMRKRNNELWEIRQYPKRRFN